MNNKSLFIGTVVFALGMGTGYFVGVKRVKARHQEDLAEVKDFYTQKLEEMGVQPEGFDLPEPGINGAPESIDEEMSEEYFNKISGYSSAATKTNDKGKRIVNYNKPPIEFVAREAFEQPEPEDQEPDDEADDYDYDYDEEYEAELDARAEDLAQRRTENQANGNPYVINYDEYEDGPENYTRNILYYYCEDRVLCEDDDTIVEDEEVLVGFDYEDILDMQTTAWVRNDTIMNLYQIHRLDQSYAKSVANVAETPREREFRIIGRRKEGLDN